jgi:hypothetical protein
MSSKLNTAIAVAGIDIGKNSFHVIGAEDCRCKANETRIETAKQQLLDMERRWLFLAHSYEFTERLTDFNSYAKA